MKTFEERLPIESAAWVRDGLVTEEQRRQMLALYPAASSGGANRFLAILATIGGALFTVGVSLIIKANWEEIGDWVKIGGVVALLVGLSALGWRLKVAPGAYPKTGDASLMAASVFFLLGIALVSQIFHIESRPANGVLLWWAGIAALPWLTRARGAQFVSVVAALTWFGLEFGARDSWLRLVDGDRWMNENEAFLFSSAGVLMGTALLGFGKALRSGSGVFFAGVHEMIGLLCLSVSLYSLGFTWSAHTWSHYELHGARWQPVAVVTLIALISVAVAWTRNRADVLRLGWSLLVASVPAFAHLLGFDLGDSGWLWGGIASLALFLVNVSMIRAGLATGRESWINLGIAFIALNIVTRYFLLFGSMLDGGVFFIVTGMLVLGLGYFLERKRRQLVATVRQEGVS